MSADNLCMGCMKEIEAGAKCPYCGFLADTPQPAPYLPYRSVIGGRYLVGRVLAAGGDGVTYMGWDGERESPVTVREFLPDGHAERAAGSTQVRVKEGSELIFRDRLEAFLSLWRKLFRLSGFSALIPVLDIAQDNGTAYAVSEYVENVTLREFLLKSRTGYLGWEQAKALLMPVLTALSALHEAGVYHLGISPNTLILGRDGKLRLTGYMVSDARLTNTDLNSQLISGYTPIEQYDFDGKVGAWSDVYSFTAVAYRTLIGSTPNDAGERVTNDRLMIPAKFAEVLPAYLVSALQNGLQLRPEDRIKTAGELREQLSGSPTAMEFNKSQIEKAALAEAATTEEEKEERRRKEKLRREQARKETRTKIFLTSFAVCLVLGFLLLGVLYHLFEREGRLPPVFEQPSENVAQVRVPDFAGESYARITNDEVLSRRFKFTAEYEYSDDVKIGLVIGQSIDEGVQIPEGSRLTLTVSKGPELIVIPNVSGMDYIFAEAKLRALGLEVKKAEKENDGTHTAGEVITTTPGMDARVKKHEVVYVQVWGEPPVTATPGRRSFFGDLFR